MDKSSGIRIRINPILHQEFLNICRANDVAASEVLRSFIKDYVNKAKDKNQSDLFEKTYEQSKQSV